MAQVETGNESAPAAASGESNYLAQLESEANAAFAALEDTTPQSAEAAADTPAESGSEAVVVSDTQEPALESAVDAELAGPDNEQITRRNARELVEKARAEKEEALKAASIAEQAKADADAREAARVERYRAIAQTWGSARQNADALRDAIVDENWEAIDTIAEKFGVSNPSIADARALRKQLEEQDQRNVEMAEYNETAFKGGVGVILKKISEKREGVSYETLMKTGIEEGYDHVWDAATARMQGKYDALLAEFNAFKARAGALSPSPESGGVGASSSAVPKTVQELQRMSHADFEKNFDKILQAIPT